jgi:hypothetical protein
MPKRPKDQALIELTHDFSVESANLIQMWANAETWFIHILAMLLRCDLKRADLVFYSFTSTRARVDLIRRAAIMCLQYPRDIRHLFKMCKQFDGITSTRNKICHAEYHIGPGRRTVIGLVSTNYQRSDFDGINHFEYRDIDRGLINELKQARHNAVSLCGRLARFVKNHTADVLKRPRSQPAPLDKIHKSRPRRTSRKRA